MLLQPQKDLIITEESFVREMNGLCLRKLADPLNLGNLWESVAEKIPKDPESLFGNAPFEARYSAQNLMSFAAKNERRGGNAAKSMLVDWSTQNVRIKHLLAVLHQCRLWKLVNYIERDVLGKNLISRNMAFLIRMLQPKESNNEPETAFARNVLEEVSGQQEMAEGLLADNQLVGLVPPGQEDQALSSVGERRISHDSGSGQEGSVKAAPPSHATVTRAASGLLDSLNNTVQASPESEDNKAPDTPPNFHLLKHISFPILRKITKEFDPRDVSAGGSVLGEGGFGTVHLATFHTGFKVAVKFLRENSLETMDQFKTEVELLCTFKHTNVVQLLGYSVDGANRCLIYQFMPQGSLEDRLACKHQTPPLDAATRLLITHGTAEGIVFLNNGRLTHRDIKTANILLDNNFTPKVSDFATARVAPMSGETFKGTTVIGSAPYLAPEVFNFKIHPRLDSYSFGVVILEILTGLPPLDDSRESGNLAYYMKENCMPVKGDDDDDDYDDDEEEEEESQGTIHDFLDSKAGSWGQREVVDTLYVVAMKCLETEVSRRPTVAQVLPELTRVCVPSSKSFLS